MVGTAKSTSDVNRGNKNKKIFAVIMAAVFIVAAVGAALLLSQNVAAEPRTFRYGTIERAKHP